MEIEWIFDFETGNEAVDFQHSCFIDLIKHEFLVNKKIQHYYPRFN